MTIKHSKTASPNEVVASADFNADHIIDDIELGTGKKIYFDTGKTQYLYYNADVDELVLGYKTLATIAGLEIWTNVGIDGGGNWAPSFEILPAGFVKFMNTSQGDAANRYFFVDFTSGTRLKMGSYYVALKNSNLTASRDLEFPNAAGTFIGTGNTEDIMVAAPAAANSAGTAGQIAYDAGFFYVCVGANSWKRVAIAAW